MLLLFCQDKTSQLFKTTLLKYKYNKEKLLISYKIWSKNMSSNIDIQILKDWITFFVAVIGVVAGVIFWVQSINFLEAISFKFVKIMEKY
jgi:hypothetical protein